MDISIDRDMVVISEVTIFDSRPPCKAGPLAVLIRRESGDPWSGESCSYDEFEGWPRISGVMAGDAVEQESLEAGCDSNSGRVWFAGSEAGQGDDAQGFHRRPPPRQRLAEGCIVAGLHEQHQTCCGHRSVRRGEVLEQGAERADQLIRGTWRERDADGGKLALDDAVDHA